jgi:hypothetical protein
MREDTGVMQRFCRRDDLHSQYLYTIYGQVGLPPGDPDAVCLPAELVDELEFGPQGDRQWTVIF